MPRSRKTPVRRRLVLSILGLPLFVAAALRAQAPPAMQVCDGPYALCAAAACKPIPAATNGAPSPATEALCACLVARGANIGPGSCDERSAAAAGGQPVSTYSFALAATHPTMACPAGPYTNCFGSPCLVDPNDPAKAACTCPIDPNTARQPFVTQGGGCDSSRCEGTLWSSTTPANDAAVNKILASALGLAAPPSNFCPSSVATASAEKPCADYCYQVMGKPGVCTGEYQIYDSVAACLKTCKDFPADGADGAVSGNSVQCRTEHAILAQGPEGPEKHCPHAAPLGGGVCTDRSPCEAYCVFYFDRVTEGDCPNVDRWGSSPGTIEQGSGRFTPNPKCLETCAGFAEAGQEWEMSGDSANCRQQFYLLAHRQAPPDGPANGKTAGAKRVGEPWKSDPKLASLCRNARPMESEMCQGYTFGDYFKVRQTDPCKELCYNDWLSCGSSWGTPEQCMQTCALLPTRGARQDTQGDSVYCRLTWAEYAFFVKEEPAKQKVFCEFAQPQSPVCSVPGSTPPGQGATLPADVQKALAGHHH